MATPYEQVSEFHRFFAPTDVISPTPLSREAAGFRAGFKAEELVEFLAASSGGDEALFQQLVSQFQTAVTTAAAKQHLLPEAREADCLTGQVDALLDLLYFTYGSFVLLGVDPTALFGIVHQANMGKLFPDGTVHHDPVTGKVLKPANWAQEFAPEEKIQLALRAQQQNTPPQS